MPRLRNWVLRLAIGVGIVAVLLISTTYVLLGTETGTRWLLAKTVSYLPVEADTEQSTGTLLTTVVLPGFRFNGDTVAIAIRDIEFSIAWAASTLDHVAIDHLSAGTVDIQTSDSEDEPADDAGISMPDLPIAISVGTLWTGRLAVNDVEISDISIGELDATGHSFSAGTLGAKGFGIAAKGEGVSISVSPDLPLSGSVDWRSDDGNWSGAGTVKGSLAELEFVHDLRGEFPARSSGTAYILDQPELTVDATTNIENWQLGDWHIMEGTVQIVGTLSEYETDLKAKLEYQQKDAIEVEAQTRGDSLGFNQVALLAQSAYGSASGTGSIEWSPKIRTDLYIVANDVDPSYFVSAGTGNIDGEFRLTTRAADDFQVAISSLSGNWNGNRAGGRGNLTRIGTEWRCNNCQVAVGTNKLHVDGHLRNRSIAATVDIDAPRLQQLWPGISGALSANGRLSGTLSLPTLSGRVSSQDFVFREWSVAEFSAVSRGSTPESVDFTVQFEALARDGTLFGNGHATFVGAPEEFDVDAAWTLNGYSAAGVAKINLQDELLAASIHSLQFSEPLTGNWRSTEPFDIRVEPRLTTVSTVTWENGDARLRLGDSRYSGDTATGRLELSNVPIQPLNAFLPLAMRATGFADATLEASLLDETWSGNLDWSQRETRITIQSGATDSLVVDIPVLTTVARLNAEELELQTRLHVEPGFQATIDASVNKLGGNPDLQGRFRLVGENWDWLAALLPDIDNISGAVTADVSAAGPLQSPDLNGSLNWTDGTIAVPSLNLQLSEVGVQVTGTSAGDMTVAGDARSGGGDLSVTGRIDDILSESPEFRLSLNGDKAMVLNWPDYQLVASPALSVAGTFNELAITGEADLDRAEIHVRELPEGAVTPSDDVIVEGREAVERQRTRITGDVMLTLGKDIHVQAYGLDTNVEGQLRFVVPDDRDPVAEGELRLEKGFFEAYGQRLEIERGVMLFTGPLDDPLIDVRAVREIDNLDGKVKVGLDLRGRAQNLSSSIYSEPAMSEAEALAYLMLGRPLDSATAADGNTLSNTAFALGLRQAALITNEIGQTVGLDELTVTGNNQNTAALVAGKQISSRLYARYAYGVFTQLGSILLRYRLNESFTIEVGAGEAQSMDVLYTIEKP